MLKKVQHDGLAGKGWQKRTQHDGKILAGVLVLLLAACSATPPPAPIVAGPVEVQILALNDFHGNLEPPNLTVPTDAGAVPAGGAAYHASALKQARTEHSVTVAAGDLIGASPISSALFLDEPTIRALGMAGLEIAAVGNHEFDKGLAELERMQRGGCEKFTRREPCAEPERQEVNRIAQRAHARCAGVRNV